MPAPPYLKFASNNLALAYTDQSGFGDGRPGLRQGDVEESLPGTGLSGERPYFSAIRLLSVLKLNSEKKDSPGE